MPRPLFGFEIKFVDDDNNDDDGNNTPNNNNNKYESNCYYKICVESSNCMEYFFLRLFA